jgi:hypothetical protein
MKMFEPIVIVCDESSWDVAFAIRSSLELFRLHVYLHYGPQIRNFTDALAGGVPKSEYLVLCSHGLGEDDGETENAREMKMGFLGVDRIDGEWQGSEFVLTPSNIRDRVSLPGRSILALGCGNGREPLARAFLDAGCRSYMGAVRDTDQDSTALFAITFFYYLMRENCDLPHRFSERESFEQAKNFDPTTANGTGLFRYYSKEDSSG